MKPYTVITHYPDGSKEEREGTLQDLNIGLRDHLELRLHQVTTDVTRRYDGMMNALFVISVGAFVLSAVSLAWLILELM